MREGGGLDTTMHVFTCKLDHSCNKYCTVIRLADDGDKNLIYPYKSLGILYRVLQSSKSHKCINLLNSVTV